MNFWDQNFSVEGYKYGTAPNAFMAEQAMRLPRCCEVLVPGDGEGRNGVWLAEQGHHVTAMDSSRVGLHKAKTLANERHVALQTVLADLNEWTPPPSSADALVLIYLHLPPGLRSAAHTRLAQALRPQGLLILESFHPLQLNHQSGGPKDVAMLYTLDLLRQDFPDFKELLAFEGETLLDEGPGHQGLAHVTRWVAQRV